MLYLHTTVSGKASVNHVNRRILMQINDFFNPHFLVIKRNFLSAVPSLPFLFIYLFSLLFFIKKTARMGTKYYKNFIEHPAYLHNQRQKKKCRSKLQCKF